MLKNAELTASVPKFPDLESEMDLIHEKEKQTPGTWKYHIKRYRQHPGWNSDDMGVFVYHLGEKDASQNYLELRFCLVGNVYCSEKHIECDNCRLQASRNCEQKISTVDFLQFRFEPQHLVQFAKGMMQANLTDDILNFRHLSSISRTLPLCSKIRSTLENILNHRYEDALENIFINAQMQILLLYSMECMAGLKDEEMITCKFLHNDADREKIIKAREILIQHIGDPITIKELSRKVAINECYLKKGFKELYGTTIFDFYQNQRMEHARYLLYEKGLNVSEVSALLGYSSISHFSTAFKKHTGLKPCELLIR
ncbi:MAG: helix-turn-helix domain-containing protein [Chitinophagaceae bacterium]